MVKIGDILTRFNPLEDKYISREFQAYGVYLSEKLNDIKHKSLYIKLAKTIPRPTLEKALEFAVDANVKRKGALFMWKLKELGAWKKGKSASAKALADKSVEGGKKLKKKIKDIPF